MCGSPQRGRRGFLERELLEAAVREAGRIAERAEAAGGTAYSGQEYYAK